MTILIIDYGMSNLGSIKRGFESCGADVLVSEDPKAIRTASKIVLPGVGSFADGMANLIEMGWSKAICNAVINDNIPLLGICLGMQLLATRGDEGGDCAGLDLIPGNIKKMAPLEIFERIPHIGWNEVHYSGINTKLFEKIPDNSDFYFVHSYEFIVSDEASVLAATPYSGQFVSAVKSANAFGVQFHPEKSGQLGLQLLKNFTELRPTSSC